jgi:hypothetical protein
MGEGEEEPVAMCARGIAALVAALATASAVAGEPCVPPAGFTSSGRIDSRDTVILYRTLPPRVEIGRHFAVDAVVCSKTAPSGLRVDAQMPEHRHGMNYRPRVTPKGDGRYLAEGLLFHMPGRWQFLFDVEHPGRTERLAADVVVE